MEWEPATEHSRRHWHIRAHHVVPPGSAASITALRATPLPRALAACCCPRLSSPASAVPRVGGAAAGLHLASWAAWSTLLRPLTRRRPRSNGRPGSWTADSCCGPCGHGGLRGGRGGRRRPAAACTSVPWVAGSRGGAAHLLTLPITTARATAFGSIITSTACLPLCRHVPAWPRT